MIMYLLISPALIVVDRVSKWLTVDYLKSADSVDLIPDVLSLTYVENRGAAFGILQDARWLFVVVTVAVLVALGVYIVRSKPEARLFRWAVTLIYAGALGNLIDRIAFGYVVDMIREHFFDFPVFNFADCCIVVGTAVLCVHILLKKDS